MRNQATFLALLKMMMRSYLDQLRASYCYLTGFREWSPLSIKMHMNSEILCTLPPHLNGFPASPKEVFAQAASISNWLLLRVLKASILNLVQAANAGVSSR